MGTGTRTSVAVFTTASHAEQAFYDALGKADVDALMQVWADEEDIVCIHPGDVRLVGHHQIRQSWQEILVQGALAIHLTRTVSIQTVMSATHCSIECVTVRTQQGLQQAYCDVTNIFHKGPTGWRLIVHHASPADPQVAQHDSQDTPGLLH